MLPRARRHYAIRRLNILCFHATCRRRLRPPSKEPYARCRRFLAYTRAYATICFVDYITPITPAPCVCCRHASRLSFSFHMKPRDTLGMSSIIFASSYEFSSFSSYGCHYAIRCHVRRCCRYTLYAFLQALHHLPTLRRWRHFRRLLLLRDAARHGAAYAF